MKWAESTSAYLGSHRWLAHSHYSISTVPHAIYYNPVTAQASDIATWCLVNKYVENELLPALPCLLGP